MKKFWKTVFDVIDDILAYILTVAGILFSNGLTLMSTNQPFTLDVGVWRIVLAMLIAFAFVCKQEYLPDAPGVDKATARAGRKRNFFLRMSNALSQGFMWSQMMDAAKAL